MRALFIGGTGTISMAISRLLVEQGWELYLLNRGSRKNVLDGQVKQIVADISKEQEVAEKIKKRGGIIELGAMVDSLVLDNNMLKKISYIKSNGKRVFEEADVVISTMPLSSLFANMTGSVPISLRMIANGLKYRDCVIMGLCIKWPELSNGAFSMENFPERMIYVQDPKIKLARIQVYNNWSPYLVKKKNELWLGLEFFCKEGDDFWNLSEDECAKIAVSELKKIGFIESGREVVCYHREYVPKAYPAYAGSYEKKGELLSFVDGKTIKTMTSAQDHKRAGDGDTGLNTGGMGTFSPSPFYTKEVEEFCEKYVYQATVDAMAAEGRPFKGVIFFGLMLTEDGPKVLEYNARFGDPEAQVVLPRMKNDILEVMEACIDGTLDQVDLQFEDNAAVCVVLASDGYPVAYEKGLPITGLDEFKKHEGYYCFHAGTKFDGDQIVTNGGRVLGVTAKGATLKEARANAYKATEWVKFDNKYMRHDIGKAIDEA